MEVEGPICRQLQYPEDDGLTCLGRDRAGECMGLGDVLKQNPEAQLPIILVVRSEAKEGINISTLHSWVAGDTCSLIGA